MIEEEKIEFRISLKTALTQTLIKTKKVHLAFRPSNVKFDETKPLFLASLNELHGFSVGQRIFLGESKYYWLSDGNLTVPYIGTSFAVARLTGCHICGFFKLLGHIINTKIEISDMFCALANHFGYGDFDILKKADEKSPILLFWVEGLKLVTTNIKL